MTLYDRKRAWKLANKDKVALSNKKYSDSHKEEKRIHNNEIRIRRHGLPAKQAKEMITEFPYCLICGSIDWLVIDHDHETGMIRGVLCTPCNLAIGHFNDNPELLIAAMEYLQKIS